MPTQEKKDESQAGQPETEDSGKKKGVVTFWSACDPNHTLAIQLGGRDGRIVAISFKGYTLAVDLSDAVGKEVFSELRKHDRFGKDVFLVEDRPYAEKNSARGRFLKRLHDLVEREGKNRASDHIRALFTRKELKDAGLSSSDADPVALTDLAMRRKSLVEEL